MSPVFDISSFQRDPNNLAKNIWMTYKNLLFRSLILKIQSDFSSGPKLSLEFDHPLFQQGPFNFDRNKYQNKVLFDHWFRFSVKFWTGSQFQLQKFEFNICVATFQTNLDYSPKNDCSLSNGLWYSIYGCTGNHMPKCRI